MPLFRKGELRVDGSLGPALVKVPNGCCSERSYSFRTRKEYVDEVESLLHRRISRDERSVKKVCGDRYARTARS